MSSPDLREGVSPLPVAPWAAMLDAREQQEVLFALLYHRQFHHGTSDHLGYTVIAKLVDLIEQLVAERSDA